MQVLVDDRAVRLVVGERAHHLARGGTRGNHAYALVTLIG